MDLGYEANEAVDLVRERRGLTEDGFGALSNPAFVEWLLAQ